MDLQDEINIKSNTFLSIRYESRLVSGVIERRTLIKDFSNEIYKYGVFELEQRQDYYNIYNKEDIKSDDFIIDGDKAVKYIGTKKIISIPLGITEIASCAFWDNQSIEEVIIPDTVVNLGGDTDTIVALVGAISGIQYKNVPKEWLKNIRKEMLIKTLCLDINENT